MSDAPAPKILVWDAPTRAFHWLTVLSFSLAYLTAESERWRLVHITLGYTLAGLVMFRIVWGIVGTRYARFSDFVRPPALVWQYLRTVLQGRPKHYTGHNPAGAVAIVGILLCASALGLSGWASFNEIAGEWVTQWHAWLGHALLVLVLVHLAGVVVGSVQHRENLARAMVSGYKTGTVYCEAVRPWRGVALLLVLSVLCFWYIQWSTAP